MFGEIFSRLIGQITVKEENGVITITGSGLNWIESDITAHYNTSRIYKNIVNIQTNSKITFYSFFALDMEYMLRDLSMLKKSQWGKRNYLKLLEELRANTWLGKIESNLPGIFNMDKVKDVTLTLLDYQRGFLEYYDKILPRYNLRGLLFAGEPGTGKTLTSIAVASVYEAENVIIISPKNAVFDVWQNTLDTKMTHEQTTWVKASGRPIPKPDKNRWYIFHYESLDDALELAKEIKHKKCTIILDECLHSDTEVLTPQGFKRITDITADDLVLQYNHNGTNSWVNPSRIVTTETLESHQYIHKRWEQHVTPNHRMIFWKSSQNKHKPWVLQESLSKDFKPCPYTKTICSGNLVNLNQPEIGLSLLERLLIAVQADGSVNYVSHANNFIKIDFQLSKERKIARLLSILDGLEYEYNFYNSNNDSDKRTRIVVKIPLVNLDLIPGINGNADTIKHFKEWVNLENKSSLWCRQFIEELVEWDGYKFPMNVDGSVILYYSSTIQDNVDIVQLIAANGRYIAKKSVQVDDRKETYNDVYRLHIYDNDIASNGTAQKIVHRYDSPQTFYCLTVPSGMFYVRYNNKISVTGNCHNFNDPKSQRTQKFIDLCNMMTNSIVVELSGTPMKALGNEAIPLFRAIDPLFTPQCAEKFKKIFGKDAKKATEILTNRLGIVMYKAVKPADKVSHPIEHIVKIQVPNAERFTLPYIKDEMEKFIKERMKYYKDNKRMFNIQYETGMDYFKENVLPKMTQKVANDLLVYEEYIDEFRAFGYDQYSSPPKALFCNHYEKTYIEPNLPNELRKQFRNAKSVVKYVDLKIRGECLGTVLSRARTDCNKALLEHIDFPSMIDNAEKKTLIFTSYVEVVKDCHDLLSKIGYKPIMVFAETNHLLPKIVKSFGEDENINPLIATYQSLSTAVPLVMANCVILLNSPFRIHEKEQTIARANRLGQDKTVHVYNILLDTGSVPNISTRSNDIMEWSKEQVNALMGFQNDINVGLEDVTEENIYDDEPEDVKPVDPQEDVADDKIELKEFFAEQDIGKCSDGSHTFDELYYHRMVLFSMIVNQNTDKAWKSKLHSDGTMFDDYFIVGINTPEGNYTYHYHLDHWDNFNCKELELAPEWDGHTPKDIVRLYSLLK